MRIVYRLNYAVLMALHSQNFRQLSVCLSVRPSVCLSVCLRRLSLSSELVLVTSVIISLVILNGPADLLKVRIPKMYVESCLLNVQEQRSS